MNSIFDMQLNTKGHASPFAGSIILFIRSSLKRLIIALHDFGLPGSFKNECGDLLFRPDKNHRVLQQQNKKTGMMTTSLFEKSASQIRLAKSQLVELKPSLLCLQWSGLVQDHPDESLSPV